MVLELVLIYHHPKTQNVKSKHPKCDGKTHVGYDLSRPEIDSGSAKNYTDRWS